MNINRKDLLNAAWIIGICFILGSCTIAGAIESNSSVNDDYYEQQRFNDNFERFIEILEAKGN
ncbi:hypothetical protein H9655_04395 [Cytobacillus sp. Sa5YUA1]|uniref:Uncharacterized protein n=1 Tax=Cytobacillus stercorigallinarum TaxID=2762240 RepID=A0ABR8QL63_9BACI|nr:hypothetical protein [Cytobacillus stercorigallinarum]MBD7936258.1 hypothetical protein [Cytobacillus stercorigallinarum]